jgi:hypothetical protein
MGLFLGAQTQLLPDSVKHGPTAAHEVLRVLAYSGIVINAGGALTCMYILVHLSALPLLHWRLERNWDKPPPRPELSDGAIFHYYGAPSYLEWLARHVIISIFFGAVIMFSQAGMMAFLDEGSKIVPYFVLVCILAWFLPVPTAFLYFNATQTT